MILPAENGRSGGFACDTYGCNWRILVVDIIRGYFIHCAHTIGNYEWIRGFYATSYRLFDVGFCSNDIGLVYGLIRDCHLSMLCFCFRPLNFDSFLQQVRTVSAC